MREPVELDVLLDSEAIVRPVAAPSAMVEQWRHLLAMAERPNVSIRLVPSAARGYNPMLAGSFGLLAFPTAPSIAHVEHGWASAFLWSTADVRYFSTSVEEIHEIAMTPEETSEVIAKLIVDGMEKSTT